MFALLGCKDDSGLPVRVKSPFPRVSGVYDPADIDAISKQVRPSFVFLRYDRQVWLKTDGRWSDVTTQEFQRLYRELPEAPLARSFVAWGEKRLVEEFLNRLFGELGQADPADIAKKLGYPNSGRDAVVTKAARDTVASISHKKTHPRAPYFYVNLWLHATRKRIWCKMDVMRLRETSDSLKYVTSPLAAEELESLKAGTGATTRKPHLEIEIESDFLFHVPSAGAARTRKSELLWNQTPAGRFAGFWDDDDQAFWALGLGRIEWHDVFMTYSTRKPKAALDRMVVDVVLQARSKPAHTRPTETEPNRR